MNAGTNISIEMPPVARNGRGHPSIFALVKCEITKIHKHYIAIFRVRDEIALNNSIGKLVFTNKGPRSISNGWFLAVFCDG